MKKVLQIFFVVVVLFGAFCAYKVFYEFTEPDYTPKAQDFISQNQRGMEKILTEVMDQAKKCDQTVCAYGKYTIGNQEVYSRECMSPCHENIKDAIYTHLKKTENLRNFPSTYFIRVNGENTIEKLFLSGEFKSTPVTTNEERRVADYLLGKRTNINLINWSIDGKDTNMIYLKDFRSEAEFVIPVRKDNNIIGAMVRLHGD